MTSSLSNLLVMQKEILLKKKSCRKIVHGGVHSVIIIVVGNRHSNPNSNSRQDFVFHIKLIPLRKV